MTLKRCCVSHKEPPRKRRRNMKHGTSNGGIMTPSLLYANQVYLSTNKKGGFP